MKELRLWWQLRNSCVDVALTEHELKFCKVEGPQTFDAYCYVLKKVSLSTIMVPIYEFVNFYFCPVPCV